MTNKKLSIECKNRQRTIELLTMSKMLLIRACCNINDDTFDVIHDIDVLIENEIDAQKFMIENEKQLQFIEHVLNHIDCEFVDDFVQFTNDQFDEYYKMNLSNID